MAIWLNASRAGLLALLASCDPIANPIRLVQLEIDGDAQLDTGAPDVAPEAMPDVIIGPVCGDGVKQDDEACDDGGNPTPGFGCNDTCDMRLAPSCGDGVRNGDEQCDEQSAYCNDCRIIGQCGDGILQASLEECDDRGETATCNTNCTVARCGDGIVNRTAGESCDDGANDGMLGSCLADCTGYSMPESAATFWSCRELHNALTEDGVSPRTGFYWLITRNSATPTPYVAYCDMMSDGGGWTLIMRVIDTNFEYNDPLWWNDQLLNPDSFDFQTRGTRSKYRAYNEVPLDEIRTSDVDRVLGFSVRVLQPNARALFGTNDGAGVAIEVARGADAPIGYFDERTGPNDRAWGCREHTNIGLNQKALLGITERSEDSIQANAPGQCDWDGGARFGQRVNVCNYFGSSTQQCGGDHEGQGWGNFYNYQFPNEGCPNPRGCDGNMPAKAIRQLLWVR